MVVHEYFTGIFSQRLYFNRETCISLVVQRDERERGRKGEGRREERASSEMINYQIPLHVNDLLLKCSDL